ncbi:hypothetical protein [Kiloniella laminariae]|uniref:hypothetical protein n=1 Tax=Kiloniella laminariae TaxID=454162 RepID=UPI00035ECA38|nr:hypothetical protein [Kiloniella laminariae]
MSPQEVARINQVYRAYLNSLYEIDYHHECHDRLASRSQHIDFLIALGAASSGGTGLGILASPDFAWLCAILTTISTIGAVAKGIYDWSGRLKKSIEQVEFHTPVKHGLANLIEDIKASQAWSGDFEARYTKLRDELALVPVNSGNGLSVEIQRQIQNRIKDRLQYRNWWGWQEQ